jgi:hypothetical protein
MILQEGKQNGGPDMTAMKIPGLVLLALLFLIPWCSAGSVPALNTVALPAQPYITINPVGDHTLDEVFFISGTTNLPVSDSPLLFEIGSNWYNPGGSGCGYQSNVTIKPGVNGINTWSCNATPALWQTYGNGPRPHITAGAVTGEYMVKVSSLDPRISANATGFFSILSPGEIERSTTASPGLTPTPTITVVRDTMESKISDSPAPVQNSTQGTTAATGNPSHEVPTTHPVSLPLAVSIAATCLGLMVIHRSRKS